MITIVFFLIIFIFLEFFESTWQRSETLHGVIYNNYYMFKKNMFLYFGLNITFFYTLFLSFYLNNFSFWMSSIIVVKFFDIAFRLSLVKKIDEGKEITDIVPIDMKMTNIFRYLNVVIYPLTFIFAVV